MTTTIARTALILGLTIAGAGLGHAQDRPARSPMDGPLGRDPVAPVDTPAGRVARTFYDAFCRGDVATVERLYATDVKFQDEIFTFADREGTVGMWRVLLAPSAGARFSYELLGVQGDVATVLWKADYRFPSPSFGRDVHNEVTARLVVRDGKIVEHRDSFSWARWSRQALPLGVLSTWRPVERAIKATMRALLARQARAANEAARAAAAPAEPTRGIEDRLQGR